MANEPNIFELKIPKGATISSLAKEYKTDLDTIGRLNPKLKERDATLGTIYEGEILKLLKLKPEDASEDYKTEFSKEIENLYKGVYGIEWAREKLGKKLEIRFPKIDIWTDIYSKIPDEWAKIAFPITTIKKEEELPEPKKSTWERVGFFIDQNIIEPVKSKVREVAFEIFKKTPDIPTPEEVFREARDIVRAYVIKPITQIFDPLIFRAKEMPSFLKEAVENESSFGIKITEDLNKATVKVMKRTVADTLLTIEALNKTRKVVGSYLNQAASAIKMIIPESVKERLWNAWYIEVPKEQWEMRQSLEKIPYFGEGLKVTRIAGEEELEGIADIKAGKTSDDLRKDPQIAIGALTQLNSDLLDLKDRAAKVGTILVVDEEGWVVSDEEASMKAKKDILQKLIDTYLKYFKDSDPGFDLALFRKSQIDDDRITLVNSLISNLRFLRETLITPEAQRDSDLKTLSKRVDSMIEASSYLEAIDPTLESLDTQLERFNRSRSDVESYYRENLPKWWAELESILGKDLTSLLQKSEEMTESEQKKFNEFLTTLSADRISKVFSNLKAIDSAQSFYNLENGFQELTFDPELVKALRKSIELNPKLADSKAIKAINELIDYQDWWTDHKKEIQKGFVQRLQEAETSEEFKTLGNEIKTNEVLTKDQVDAALSLIAFFEEDVRVSSILEEKFHELGKIAEIYRVSSLQEQFNKAQAESDRMKSWLKAGTLKTIFFPFTSATFTDLVTGFSKTVESIWTSPWLAFPSPRKMKRLDFKIEGIPVHVDVPWDLDFIDSPQEIVSRWWKPIDYYLDEIFLKGMVPFFNATMMSITESLKQGAQNNIFEGFPILEEIGKLDRRSYEALKSVFSYPTDTFAENSSTQDGLMYGMTFWTNAFMHFRNPSSWETFKIREDTKVEVIDGKVRLGGYEFANLRNKEDLFRFNPKLKNVDVVPKGTTITIPRFHPAPKFTDAMTESDRFEFYKKNPTAAMIIDDVLVWLPPIEDLFLISTLSRLKAMTWVKKFGTFKPLNTLKNIDVFRPAAETLQKYNLFSDAFLKLISGRGVNWDRFPKSFNKIKVPLQKARAIIFQTTTMNSLPANLGASINSLNKQIAFATTEGHIAEETAEMFRNFIRFWEDASKTNPKKYGKFSVDKFKRDINLALFDITRPVEERITRLFNGYGLTIYDLMEWGQARPYLKDPVKRLFDVGTSQQGFMEALAWESEFRTMNKYGQDLYSKLRIELAKETDDISKLIKDKSQLIKFSDNFLSEQRRLNPTDFAAMEVGIKKAKTMGLNWIDGQETIRKSLERARIIVPWPNGIEIRIPDEPAKLLKRGELIYENGKHYFIMDPARYYHREHEFLGDLIGQFVARRWDNFTDIPFAEAGIKLTHKETQKYYEQIYVSTQKILSKSKKMIKKGTKAHSEDWVNSLGKNKFNEYVKKKNLRYLGDGKEFRITEDVPYIFADPPLSITDALESDYFQNFLVRDMEGIDDIRKYLLKTFPKRPKKVMVRVSKRTSMHDQELISMVNKQIKPWSTFEFQKTVRTLETDPAGIKLFYQRAAFLDFLKQTPSGRKELNRYKNFLTTLKEGYHTKISKLDNLLITYFGQKDILSPFSRILLIEDSFLPYQKAIVDRELKRFAEHALRAKRKVLIREFKKIRKWEPESILDHLDLSPLDSAVEKLNEVRNQFKTALKEKAIDTILPKLAGYFPKGRRPPEALTADITDWVGTQLVRYRNKTRQLFKSKPSRTIEIIKSMGKDRLPPPGMLIITEADKRNPKKLLDIIKSSEIYDYVNPGFGANRLYTDDDLLKIIACTPSNWQWAEQRRSFKTINLEAWKKTEIGRKIRADYRLIRRADAKRLLSQKKGITKKTFTELYEKIGLPPKEQFEAGLFQMEDFWATFYNNFRSVQTQLKVSGFSLDISPATGKILKLEMIAAAPAKIPARLPATVDEAKTLTKKVFKDFSNLFHLETYVGKKGLTDLVERSRKIRLLKNRVRDVEKSIDFFDGQIIRAERQLGAAQALKVKVLRPGVREVDKAKLLQKAVDDSSLYLKQLDRFRLRKSAWTIRLDTLKRELASWDSDLASLVEKWGSSKFIFDEDVAKATDFISGKTPISISALDDINRELHITRKSLLTLDDEIIKLRKAGKSTAYIWISKMKFEKKINDLDKLKELAVDIKKLNEAGIYLSMDQMFFISRNHLTKGIQTRLDDVERALAKISPSKKAPIPLDVVSQKIYDAFEPAQKRLKKLEIVEDVEKMLDDYLGKGFLTPEYAVPLIHSEVLEEGTEAVFKQIEDFRKKGVRLVVDLTGDLLKKPYILYQKPFRVISIKELTSQSLPFLSRQGDIPFKIEVDGFLKLRNAFLDAKHIVILDKDFARARIIALRLQDVYISDARKYAMKAARDIFYGQQKIAKTAVKGYPARYARHGADYVTIFGNPEKFAIATSEAYSWPKAIRRSIDKGEIDVARMEFEVALRKADVLDKKKLYELGDYAYRQPTIIISTKTRFIPESRLRAYKIAFKDQKAEFYFPLAKEMNSGENIIAQYLKANKIPYKHLDGPLRPELFNNPALNWSLSAKYPAFVFPYGKIFDSKRLAFYEGAKRGYRIFQPLESRKAEVISAAMSSVNNWLNDINKMPPSFIQRFAGYGIVKRPESVIAQWRLVRNRQAAKSLWKKRTVDLLDREQISLEEKLLRETKRKTLTDSQKAYVRNRRKEWDDVIETQTYLYDWDKKPSFLERAEEEFAKRLNLKYAKETGSYFLNGLPMDAGTKLWQTEAFLKGMIKLTHNIPRVYKAVRSSIGFFRNIWVMMILLWRPAWHVKNEWSDVVRGSMASKSLNYTLQAHLIYADASAKFIRKFAGDFKDIPKAFFRPAKNELKEIKAMVGNPMARWWDNALREARSAPYKLFDPAEAVRTKSAGIWQFLDTARWKGSHLDEFLDFQKALQVEPMITPRGEILTVEMMDYLCEAGLFQVSTDPVFARRILQIMDDSTVWRRLKKRVKLVSADLQTYAAFSENMRRQLLVHDLIFKKAMTLTEAKVKTWGYMFNYRDLTIVGKTFRYFFPFYAFNANVIRLYTKMLWKMGPRYWIAGKALLNSWSRATEDLPEWARDRIPVGNEFYWYPMWEGFQFAFFFLDPVKAFKDFAENPLKVPLGFGWDPYFTSLIGQMTKKRFWDISNDMQRDYGWTQAESEKYQQEMGIKRDISKNWWDLALTFMPLIKVFKVMFETDMYDLMDGVSIWHSKRLREWAKLFGFNILKWDDMLKLRQEYFETPPHLRQERSKQLKAENPEAWEALKRYWAKASYLQAYEKSKDQPVEATAGLQVQGWLQIYFDMEDDKQGKGDLWLIKYPDAKEAIDEFFKKKESSPFQMWNESRYNIGILSAQIKTAADSIYKKEVFTRAEILGIDIPFGVPGNKNEFLSLFFDERGNLKIVNPEEFERIMGHSFVNNLRNNTQKTWRELIKDRAELRYVQWLNEKVKGKTKEEKSFDDRMAQWQAILPAGVADLPEKESQKYWRIYWNYFETHFSGDQKNLYYQMLKERNGEWFYEYRMKMREYSNIWSKIFEKGRKEKEDFLFFDEFYSQDKWFQELYFIENPNKKRWYPFAQKWTRMLHDIKVNEEKSGIFNTEARKEASKFFWDHEAEIKSWDKDNPGFFRYMEAWKKIMLITETKPERYFNLFYAQPDWFQERFFERNPDKKEYYPFVKKWVGLIEEDSANRKIGKPTSKAKDWFWSAANTTARNLYGGKKIDKEHTVLDYLNIWKEFFYGNEDNIEKYFGFFYEQEGWFRNHFFARHPNQSIYYPAVKEWRDLIEIDKKQGTHKARDYFETKIKSKPAIAKAWNAENPGIIDYLSAWSHIMEITEENPDEYFKEFYKQSESFRERFFKANPEKKLYYPKLQVWVAKIKTDKENWDKYQKRTDEAWRYFKTWKNTEAGKAYCKDNPITDKYCIVDYLEIWHEISMQTEENPKAYFKLFDQKEQWFKDRFFKNNPVKKDYYWFAKELGQQEAENWSKYFWKVGDRYEKARKAWDEDKPGFLDYMQFWKKLSSLAETGQWDLYFRRYFSTDNKIYRERHWKNHPEAETRMKLLMEYQTMPSVTWEEKRAKRDFLKVNPELLEWWAEDLSSEEAEIRKKVAEYYELLDQVPATGIGRAYFWEVRKYKVAAEHYLEDNPDLFLHFEKNSRKETGEDPGIYKLARDYFDLDEPFQRKKFMDEHPQLKDYFNNLNPPGIRTILELQSRYFLLDDKFKAAFINLHPELLDYWEIIKLPWSAFFDLETFKPFENKAKEVEACFNTFTKGLWAEAEKMREALPLIFKSPGTTFEDDWFKNRIYSLAMKTWAALSNTNEFFAIYFFRQLPDWIRDIYYEKHPEKQYLSKYPLSRFLEEPLRIWEYLNPDLAWAYKILQKYGRNIPADQYDRVRKIMVQAGEWEDRSKWTSEDWSRYWAVRVMQLNEVNEYDFENIPLLKKELQKVQRNYPLLRQPNPFKKPRIGHIEPFF